MSYEDKLDYQELHDAGLTWLEWIGAATLATLAMAALMAFALIVG